MCDLGSQLALLAFSSRCGLRLADFICTSTSAIPHTKASSRMLILVAAWTQANYVFEQLSKLHADTELFVFINDDSPMRPYALLLSSATP
jgi:hypothetical protein